MALQHPVFNGPYAVKLDRETISTPKHYAKYYQKNPLPDSLDGWRVHQDLTHDDGSTIYGSIASGSGFEDTPDAEIISHGVNSKNPNSVAIGRHGNFLQWGFAGSPKVMTPSARDVFANAIVYISKFDRQFPKQRRRCSGRDMWLQAAFALEQTKTKRANWLKTAKQNGLSEARIKRMASPDSAVRDRAKQLFPRLHEKFGIGNLDLYLEELLKNRDYLYAVTGDDPYRAPIFIDEDCIAFGFANHDPKLIEHCIKLLEKKEDKQRALRVLKRYTGWEFETAAQWQEWFNKVRGSLYFTDTGGFRFYSDNHPSPEVEQRSTPSNSWGSNTHPVRLSTRVTPLAGEPGKATLSLKIQIKEGWHIYDQVPEGSPYTPTTLTASLRDSVQATGPWQRPISTPDPTAPGLTLFTNEANFSMPISAEIASDLLNKMFITVKFQVCTDESCLRPERAFIVAEAKEAFPSNGKSARPQLKNRFRSRGKRTPPTQVATPSNAAPKTSSPKTSSLEKVSINFKLPDGAAWDGSRTLMVPDVKGGVLWSIPTEKDTSKARKRLQGDWSISGTCYQNGSLHFVDSGKRKLFRLGKTGPPQEIAAFGEGQRPNDLVVDLRGNAYITFSREGVVRRVSAGGKISIAVADLVQPNGIGLSPDFKTLYMSSSKTGQLTTAKIDPSSDRFPTSEFAQLPKTKIGFRGDGMAVDRAGNVYCTGGRSVCVFDPQGKMIDEIVTSARPINVVFGGDIQNKLYISTFDGLYVMPREAYGSCPMPAVNLSGIDWTPQVPYADIDGRKLFMDVYRPASAPKKSPGVIVVHGGGWVKGAKEKFAALSASIARRGYVVANIEYRLAHEAKFPAAVRDCNAATAYLRTHAADLGIDPERIAVVGGSAGGHIAGLMVVGHDMAKLRHASVKGSSQFAALVVMAGPLEIATGRVADQSIAQPEKSFALVWFGGNAKQKPASYQLADVVSKIDADMPPVLFLTGSKDNPDRNKSAQKKLESLGVATELSIQEGAKHAQWNSPQFMPMFVQAIDSFLKKHL